MTTMMMMIMTQLLGHFSRRRLCQQGKCTEHNCICCQPTKEVNAVNRLSNAASVAVAGIGTVIGKLGTSTDADSSDASSYILSDQDDSSGDFHFALS